IDEVDTLVSDMSSENIEIVPIKECPALRHRGCFLTQGNQTFRERTLAVSKEGFVSLGPGMSGTLDSSPEQSLMRIVDQLATLNNAIEIQNELLRKLILE